jgi:hypothetical protein
VFRTIWFSAKKLHAVMEKNFMLTSFIPTKGNGSVCLQVATPGTAYGREAILL